MTKNKKEQKPDELDLEKLRLLLDKIEFNVQGIRKQIFNEVNKSSAKKLNNPDNSNNIIEGIFDGHQMIDADGKSYPVPENYASKSKLVEGDVLKLTVASDGTYIYKQIGPVERKKIIGDLYEQDGKYYVISDDKKYFLLTASVTYFKAKSSDKLTLIVPKNKDSQWAAVENVIQ